MRFLALSGSLRAASTNAELLRAASLLAPTGVDLVFFEGLAALPHFNPDEEGSDAPSVRSWRGALADAGGVLICSPEYAHGIPGSLKNALDWVVGSGELVDKPVALLNASPRATHAQDQLHEVLTTMSARVIITVVIPVSGRGLDARGIAAEASLAEPIRDAIDAVARAVGNV